MLPTTLAQGAYLSPSMKKELDWLLPVGPGAKGMSAKRVQEHLNLNGFSLVVDGAYGPATERQVRTFQGKSGLPPTGVVDQATHAALVDPMIRALKPIPPAGSTLSQLASAYALQHVAARAREVGGDNHGPWVRAYLGWDGKEARWCAGFVCYALEQAAHTLGQPVPITSSSSCDVLALSAQQRGLFHHESSLDRASRAATIKPGSFFLVRASPKDWIHVGIVSDADPETFDTVEGNTNDEGSPNGFEAAERVRGYAKKDFIVW